MKSQEIVIRVVVETAPPEPIVEDGFTEIKGKTYTKSQRLRFALYRRWSWLLQTTSLMEPFDSWYDTQMDHIIAAIDKKPEGKNETSNPGRAGQ